MPETSELARRFRSQELAEAFVSAYDAVLGRWPLAVTSLDVAGAYGTTHVHTCGPPGGKPLVLLHGGGCTATAWFANAGVLGRVHRVYAVDQIGDAGKSVADGRPVRRAEDLMAWLDGLLDKLGLDAAAFCGHSYGAWLALSYALHDPRRVTKLALLDPTSCFGGMSLSYRVRAVPLLARPSVQRARSFIEWETDQTALDPLWLSLTSLGGGEFRRSKLVMPHSPNPQSLRAATVPTLLLLAENSKAHNIRRIGENARRLMPQIVSIILPGATHHSIPAANPDRLNQELAGFLA
jgi:pimeloyl-ACP methyl ester carboxylesterase